LTDRPERLSILQVCSASRIIYGAVHSLLILAEAQRAGGHRVEFLTRVGKRFGADVRELGYKAHDVKIRTKIDLIAIAQMRRIIRNGKFEIVHTHLSTSTVNGTIAARAARIPCVATVHGLSGKLSFIAANHLIAVSGQAKQHMVNQGMATEKISVVYNGVHPPRDVIGTEEARACLHIEGVWPVLGTVARISRVKGIEYALEAVSKLVGDFPNLRYLIVGDGDRMESCRELAVKLGIENHVIFAGYQSDVSRYLVAMDLMLFPSIQEAMGMAIVEAFLVGVPVVGTQVGGIPEVVSPECGALVPKADAGALAAKTAELLRAPATLQSMSAAAKTRARTLFGVDTMAERTEHVYRGLLGQAYSLPLDVASPCGVTHNSEEAVR
jgi:glycosyltransferase involved in cell wall biosynthesis